MAEYDIDPRHAKNKEMALADGLSRMPYESKSQPWTRYREWEDVRMAGSLSAELGEENQVPEDEDEDSIVTFCPGRDLKIEEDIKAGQIIPNEGLLINCDGSCLDNGGTQAKATIGVFCGRNHPMNFCGTVPIQYPQTNQIASYWQYPKPY
ncbi:hypothetical protein BGX38DRAFT_1147248 [Terfezia claveryi]|nr:hypothetical protein BGX38DRAFT_1147248 [Terfezia claveryi]